MKPGATFKPARGPAHKPKTYGEQLRELQQPVAPRPSRQRPYASPYADVSGADDLSVASPWSLDHDLHDILYDGDEPSYHVSRCILQRYNVPIKIRLLSNISIHVYVFSNSEVLLR